MSVFDEKNVSALYRTQQSEIEQLELELQNQMRQDEQVVARSVLYYRTIL